MRTIALIAALCAAPAVAQENCQQRGDLQVVLEQRYGEVTVGYGLRLDATDEGEADASVLEVWVSRGGSWTIVETHSNGTACAVAYGESWAFVEQPWPQAGELN